MRQLNALCNKNWLIYKRHKVCSILQIVIPIIFLIFILIFRSLSKITIYQQQSNLSNSSLTPTLYGDPIYTNANTNILITTVLKKCTMGQIVGLVPKHNIMAVKLSEILYQRGYDIRYYNSDNEIDQHIRHQLYGRSQEYPIFCFAVSFQPTPSPTQSSTSPPWSQYKYNLRFNITIQQLPSPEQKLTIDEQANIKYFGYSLKSGAIALTTIINNIILQIQSQNNNMWDKYMLVNKMGIIYQQQYILDKLYAYLNNSFQFINLFPLLIIYLRQTAYMLQQKQKKIKQSMSISGMKIWVYYLTWFIRYFIIYLIVHVINSGIIAHTLPRIPYYIPFTIYILFDIVLILQSLFIQIFVTRSKIGIIIALVIFVFQYAINYTIASNPNITQDIYVYMSIVPFVAFVLAFKNMVYADTHRIQVSFQTLLDHYYIRTAVYCLVGNIVIWIILIWYLDQVVPNQWGTRKSLCFCLGIKKNTNYKDDKTVHQKSKEQIINKKLSVITQLEYDNKTCADNYIKNYNYSLKSMNFKQPIQSINQKQSNLQINHFQEQNENIQQVQPKFKQMQQNNKALIIRNLTKTYDDQNYAVKDLNLTIYSDQIFALLGHNGAGKTSTISMLTGMIEPTSGVIEVLGMTDLTDIRQKLGVCPQHDTLYDQLTVEEHIRLFATFRNLDSNLLDEQVNKLIKDVNLEQKRQQYAKNLSGGQKRRLSVAMAFSGGSKVIILDEPTSGMDTSARRWIWEMLKNYKNDRIIILTTHFMDEADYLGDRIAIMAQGKLMALGSNVFLKNKFGVGYNITFVKTNIAVKSDTIFDLIKKHVPNAKVLTDVSSQISIQLPLDKVRYFSALFAQIDSKKQQLGIQSYGISITTLEQVFLKIGQSGQIQTKQCQLKEKDQQNNYIQAQSFTKFQIKRSKKLTKTNQEQIDKKIDQHPTSQSQQQIINNQILEIRHQQLSFCQRFCSHMGATILKRLRVIRRDIKSFIFQLVLPMIIIVLALMLMKISFIHDFAQMNLNYDIYKSDQYPIPVPICANPNNSALLDSLQNCMKLVYGDSMNISKYYASSDILFDKQYLYPMKLENQKIRGAIYFKQQFTKFNKTWLPFTSIMNTRSPTSAITVQTLAAQTYINHITSKPISITPVNKPFPMTYHQMKMNNAISGFLGAVVFSVALSFKFASIVAFIVKQRESKCKHQQIVSGLSLTAYWCGNYIYDFILYSIVAGFSIAMCTILEIKALTQDGNYLATSLLFILYGFSNIALTYLLAYFFIDYGNAQGVIYFANFVAGGILPVIVLILRWINQDSNRVIRGFAWFIRIFPSYSFGEGLINIGSMTFLQDRQNGGYKFKALNLQIALAPIIYMISTGFIYILLIFIIERMKINQAFMRSITKQQNYNQTNALTESDVLQQQKKAIQANPQQYQILTKQLRKVYILDSDKKYKVAVDNLSFGVKKGEVFGLLGVNGAGKSTTFKMLAGEIVSTSGDAYFMGMKISENLSEIRKSLGYCPQFDALIENLTVRQQLQLYYDMKCLPRKFKKAAIDQKIKQLNLSDHQNKLSGALSGGNKRKLSVAMAMIGNPNILFLDEPSTGMDPKARRFMWKVISRISTEKKQSTVILTTHSMEEAQALSTRLGIMVNGNFKCIGTPQHIKSKYGKGFEIQIKVKPITKQQVQKMVKQVKLQQMNVTKNTLQQVLKLIKAQHLSAQINKTGKGRQIWNELQIQQKKSTTIDKIIQFSILYERINKVFVALRQICEQVQQIQNYQTFIRYKVSNNISISKLFQLLQQKRQAYNISQYSIKQATVEQIFNKFAEIENINNAEKRS